MLSNGQKTEKRYILLVKLSKIVPLLLKNSLSFTCTTVRLLAGADWPRNLPGNVLWTHLIGGLGAKRGAGTELLVEVKGRNPQKIFNDASKKRCKFMLKIRSL